MHSKRSVKYVLRKDYQAEALLIAFAFTARLKCLNHRVKNGMGEHGIP